MIGRILWLSLVTLVIAAIVIFAVWFFVPGFRTRSTNTSTNTSSSSVSTGSFRDVCDCYAIVSEDQTLQRIDVATGEQRLLLSAAALELAREYAWLELSPDGSRVALISATQSSVVLTDTISGEARTAYTAPSSDAIVSFLWSGNGKKFVAAVGARASADVLTAVVPDRLVVVDAVSLTTTDAVVQGDQPALGSFVQRPIFVSDDGGTILFADNQGKRWQWRSDSAVISELPSVIDFGTSFSQQDSSPAYARIVGGRAVFGYRTKVRIVSLADFSEKVIELKAVTDQPFSEPNPGRDALLLIQANERGSAARLVRLSLLTGELTTVLDPYPANYGLADLKWTPDGSSFVVTQNAGLNKMVGRMSGDTVVMREMGDAPESIEMFVSKLP